MDFLGLGLKVLFILELFEAQGPTSKQETVLYWWGVIKEIIDQNSGQTNQVSPCHSQVLNNMCITLLGTHFYI